MSNETFTPGDVCKLITHEHARIHPDVRIYVGQEGTILHTCIGTHISGHPFHLLEMQDGHRLCATPCCLRKRRPPQDWVTLCRLDEIPSEVTA